MARNRFRILAAGLGVFAIPACVTLQADINTTPTPLGTASPTAGPVASPSTVRRTDPPPAVATMPVQYIAIPADQLVRDASGRTMVKASAIPAGYTPVAVPPAQAPVSAPSLPVVTQPTPAPVPAVTAAAAPPVVEAMEVYAVHHTVEPPLALPDPPKRLPATVKHTPELPSVNHSVPATIVTNNANMPMVSPYPPNAQVLVQKDGVLQPINYNGSDAAPNLIMPPSPPEELKMISQSKLMGCTPTPVQAAIQAYQSKQPADAEKQLAGFDPVNRELLKKVLPIAAKLSDASAKDSVEVAEMVDQLQMAVRSKATLRIDKLCYCRLPAKPAKLGVYQPLADDHCYRIGDTVELYMELRNFSCEAKDREYQTHLATMVEVCDDRKEVVARYEFERDRPDVAAAQKHDYFHICRFPVQGLPTGQYTLNVTVTDVPTGKSATRSLPLRVDPARRVVARGTAE